MLLFSVRGLRVGAVCAREVSGAYYGPSQAHGPPQVTSIGLVRKLFGT